MKYSNYVNVFHGNGEVFWPKASSIASTWQPIKALCGNTHPHASIPLGQFSCGAYSGGYSSGYGNHKPNSWKPPEKFITSDVLRGFSHYHCSGTGALGIYYNYAVTAPYSGNLSSAFDFKKVINEIGNPGYYSATLEDNTLCEITVNENCAYHRYTYKSNTDNKLAINFSNNGLDKSLGEKFYKYAESASIEIISENEVTAAVVMNGLTLYFYAVCDAATSSLFAPLETSEKSINIENVKEKFGIIFNVNSNTANLRLSFSLKSFEQAKEFCQKHESFETCKSYTESVWNNYLSAIELEASDEDKELFYSNLYQSLIKPSDFTGQSTLFDSEKPYMLGFETLWDQYKTQLPLIFTFYKEATNKIANSYLYLGEALEMLPHTLALSNNYNIEAVQACALPEHMLIDAYYRNAKFDDMELFFSICYSDMLRIAEKLFDENGKTEFATHLLDFTDAINGLMAISKIENRMDYFEKFKSLIKETDYIFDKETGLLSAGYSYYEGNHWNYSFRLLSEMDKRIKLAGGKENFENLLDIFFGYKNPESCETRFEGFNNETDMETPFAYHYVNRHDKIAEIIKLSYEHLFFNGTGGIPGNNDTGGISSFFVFMALGIFPVTGQDLSIITIPKYKKSTLKLASNNTLTIINNCTDSYPKEAYFNNVKLDSLAIKTTQLMLGGTLEIK